MQNVEVSAFLGPVWVHGRSVVVPEAGFGLYQEELGVLYRECRDYTPGGFTVTIGGHEWLGPDLWDDVVPLARALRGALHSLATIGGAVFWLPDQPVQVRMNRQGAHLTLSLLTPNGWLGQPQVCDWLQFDTSIQAALDRLDQFLSRMAACPE
jgi:hypothetical protein